MLLKVRFNDNLQAIYTYIKSDPYFIDINELVDWCIQYEYYKELFENFHIIRLCLDQHNKDFPVRNPDYEKKVNPAINIDDPESTIELPKVEEEDDLL